MTYEPHHYEVVSREDDEVRNQSSSYRFQLLLLALLPYAYVFTILAVILTTIGLLLWTIISGEGRDGPGFRIHLALAVVAALFLRSIWVRIPPPKGVVTSGKKSPPALFTATREIARAIRGPRIHTILWTEEFDLVITSVPRVSLLGWPSRYYLEIGLPVMQALSPEQFRARLAYELGQFASTSRFRSWLYHWRFTWSPLLSVLYGRGRLGSWLFSRFFLWYVKFFNNHAQTAFRYHAYEADRCAAAVTSAEVTAEMLIRFDYNSYVQEWGKDDAATEWLQSSLEEKTYSYHLHPALKDRLAALGQTVRLPAPVAQSAAEVYLADHLPEITERLERARAERTGPTWHEPGQKPDTASRSICDQGIKLLREDREEGVAMLERAMELDPLVSATAYAQLSAYYNRQGDIITANSYRRRSDSWVALYEKTIAERAQASFVERFSTHDLSEWEIQQLRAELAKHKEIKEAYLVRKAVSYLPDQPLHTLGVVLDGSWFRKTAADLSFAKLLPPARRHPPELYTFVLDYKNRRLGDVIRNVSNSLIFQKSDKR